MKTGRRFRARFQQLNRQLTTPLRHLPSFLIIGVQNGGTTALFDYITQHPNVVSPAKPEIHFFDDNFQQGLAWYRRHFPTKSLSLRRLSGYQPEITGETTSFYSFHPHALPRIATTLPSVKLIMVLRNPIDRAYSHYCREVRAQRETLSFEAAIATEEERIQGDLQRLLSHPNAPAHNYRRYSYLGRGRYLEQIKRVHSLFSPQQLLVLKSEELMTDPRRVMSQVFAFLELAPWPLEDYQVYNLSHYQASLDRPLRDRLQRYFQPHNQALSAYFNADFSW